ncbi:MAG TPA: hypothetical protein VFL55_25555 [Acetobacteraceae bacterium]|nr:hypothetical protein [Acetobacteraceae bacterium]
MIIKEVTFAGSSSLSDLETFADQQEEVLGPLVNLGNAGPNTVLTFAMDDPPPKQFIILRLTPAGNTPVVPGFSLVCQGNCLIGGQLTGVAALRSDAEKPAAPMVKPGTALEQALTAELPAALSFKPLIDAAVSANNVRPAIIAAIGSVESGWGTSSLMHPTGPTGTGDRTPRRPNPPQRPDSMPTDGLGFGRGLMQIDWDAHEFARTGNWRDAAANIAFACELYAANRDQFVRQGHTAEDAAIAAIAAYNMGFTGASRLIASSGLKAACAAGTYADKVLSRIEFFRSKGFDDAAPAMVAAVAATGP